MVKILHITADDKFFDSVYQLFEADNRIENTAICIVDKKFNAFKYIKNTDVITPLKNKHEIKDYLRKNSYDIVYFHSLPAYNWWIIEHIPSDKNIIWWAWGFDLYYEWRGCPPHIKVDLLKPLTKAFSKNNKNKLLYSLKYLFHRLGTGPFLTYQFRKKILNRIDYFQPVLHIEYELMKQIDGFCAKEFYYPLKSLPKFEHGTKMDLIKKPILVGNSATPSNNHLDILDLLLKCGVDLNRVIIPINYGDQIYLTKLTRLMDDKYKDVCTIKDFMPIQSYFNMVSSCTHSIMGVMRQQAMGNIYQMLGNGTKIFLYKDSIPYQYLSSMGCVVYTIEDITVESLSTPLSELEIENNRQVLLREIRYKNSVYDVVMEGIIHNITEKKFCECSR